MKIAQFIAWKLPPKVLLWAVIRGFADATSGKYGKRPSDDVDFGDVYDAIVEKYEIEV